MTAPALQADNLVKKFGSRNALDGLSLTIEEGETYGIIGPNGAGKTTFIRTAVGLEKPGGGEIRVLGKVMPDRKVAPFIGYMTQKSALYADLTIIENLKFFGALYGLGGNEGKSRIAEMLEVVELTDRKDSIVGDLSGGMIQRVSLAATLLHKPKLLFLDEPTAGIDPELRLHFWNYFEQLNKEGATIIVSTHNLDEASRCNRLGMLRDGSMIAEGSPAELKSKAGVDSVEEAFLFFARKEKASDD